VKSRHSKSSANYRPRTVAERDGEEAVPAGQSGVRLQRVLAAAGVAARRICEEMIEAGRVEVNGKIQKRLPIFVDPSEDRITVDGKPIPRARVRGGAGARAGAAPGRVKPTDLGGRMLYIMLHKPPRVMSTMAEDERTTIVDLIDHPGVQSKKNPTGQRVFPVGRLDFHTAGLVLLTSDGECANRLTHPRYGVPKLYEALVKGNFDDTFAHDLTKGLSRKHVRAAMEMGENPDDPDADRITVRILERREGKTLLEITLCETSKRPLAEMLNEAGVPVTRLIRTGIGPLRLRGVGPGQWRELDRDEIRVLRSGDNRPLRGTESTRGVTPAGGRNRQNMRPAAAENAEGGEFEDQSTSDQPEPRAARGIVRGSFNSARTPSPDRPLNAARPVPAERSFNGERPARPSGDRPPPRDRNERPARSERSDRSDHTKGKNRDRSGRGGSDRADRSNRGGNGRNERSDRPNRFVQTDRNARAERPGQKGGPPPAKFVDTRNNRASKQPVLGTRNAERPATTVARPRTSAPLAAKQPMKTNPRTGRAGPRVLRPGSGS